jgi:hypothetical protein
MILINFENRQFINARYDLRCGEDIKTRLRMKALIRIAFSMCKYLLYSLLSIYKCG